MAWAPSVKTIPRLSQNRLRPVLSTSMPSTGEAAALMMYTYTHDMHCMYDSPRPKGSLRASEIIPHNLSNQTF